MTTVPGHEGTAVEVLPYADGAVLTITTDLATGQRTATLGNTPMAPGGDLAALVADGRAFRGGAGAPVIFDRVPVPAGEIDARLARWHRDHPAHEPPDDGQGQPGSRAEHRARVHAMAFRGAHGGRRGPAARG